MKKIFCVILSVLMTCALLLPAAAVADAPAAVDVSRPEMAHVSFNEEGKLTILQVADIQDNAVLSPEAKLLIKAAVEQTKPDLIVLSGDNIAGYSCKTRVLAAAAIRQFMDIFEKYGIPVAAVFGNHDDDGTVFTKEEQIAVYEKYSCFIGCCGVIADKTVDGKTMHNVGTYNVPIFESSERDKVIYNVWCFDSGNYNPDEKYGGYGYVLPEQMDWYVEKSNELKEANGGECVPSIVFQHIVPPQIRDALKEVDEDTEGAVSFAGSWYTLPDGADPEEQWLSEAPCPPNLDCEDAYLQVDTMLGQGDVNAIFFGHDHINCYIVDYEGIDLVSSPGCTYSSYNDSHRGFRTITLDKNDLSTYKTATFTEDDLSEGSRELGILNRIRAVFDSIGAFFKDLWSKIENAFSFKK